MRILLAEDDQRLGRLVLHLLEKEKHQADWLQRGDDALEYALAGHYDVIILDWMMPGMDGVSVCRQLREKGFSTPVLLLTARDAVEDRVMGLDGGADDYLVKPFEFAELMARLRALSRRIAAPLKEDEAVFGEMVLDRRRYTLRRGEEEIPLTGREFQLLDLLVQNRGQVLPRELILDRVWGLDGDVTDNTLDAYIRLLRKKMEEAGGQKLIRNIRGVGYTLEA